jgi:hypothetical protein
VATTPVNLTLNSEALAKAREIARAEERSLSYVVNRALVAAVADQP